METQHISSVKLVDGSLYLLKDAELREWFSGEIILDGGQAPIDDTESQ